ncbi:MAG TPA: outer membrane lipoprotein carrier protein LolA [Bacteroidales bacterium]|nr:outer membrane lipoprotein carrier protein LolA [Bacteroidales bacterium]HOX79256.1 outer membrane lipoprotein carrier protein LolA [Bacteroidales bacterium]HPI86259.1 outer membrane lipoprotein carrier protein LolA [Bacteroidales bacterium]HPM93482.1 outer membrane lipoprotein carrier protein LolA [Bacteroidales bacterium]
MRILSFIMIAAFVIAGHATHAQAKKTSEEILKQVSEKTKSFSSIKIGFTYNMDNASAKIHETETGILTVKGDKYRLDIAGQRVISDSKTSWTYVADANEVQINTVEDDDNALTPTKLLTSYSENYKSKLVNEINKDGRAVYVIDLKPNTEKNFTNVELQIDKELYRIVRIAIQDKSGNTFSYIVNKFEPNVPVKDTDFTFDPKEFPGVEVIDMR